MDTKKYNIDKVINYHLVAQIGQFDDQIKTSIFYVVMKTVDGDKISGIVNIDKNPPVKNELGCNCYPTQMSLRVIEYSKHEDKENKYNIEWKSDLTYVKLDSKQLSYLFDVLLERCDLNGNAW